MRPRGAWEQEWPSSMLNCWRIYWIATGATLNLYARQWCPTPDDVVQQAFIDLAARRSLPEDTVRLAVCRSAPPDD